MILQPEEAEALNHAQYAKECKRFMEATVMFMDSADNQDDYALREEAVREIREGLGLLLVLNQTVLP
jgi:hypothetical protein